MSPLVHVNIIFISDYSFNEYLHLTLIYIYVCVCEIEQQLNNCLNVPIWKYFTRHSVKTVE